MDLAARIVTAWMSANGTAAEALRIYAEEAMYIVANGGDDRRIRTLIFAAMETGRAYGVVV
jgi:hypothetical protein